jgi:Fe2+ transport system protein FeoA
MPNPLPARTTLLEIRPGGQARVVEFRSLSAVQIENLQAYGLTPGHLLRVLQQAPVTVIQIGNTELALEADLARQVEVEQLSGSSENGNNPRRAL